MVTLTILNADVLKRCLARTILDLCCLLTSMRRRYPIGRNLDLGNYPTEENARTHPRSTLGLSAVRDFSLNSPMTRT
jgi:hypothetical protein